MLQWRTCALCSADVNCARSRAAVLSLLFGSRGQSREIRRTATATVVADGHRCLPTGEGLAYLSVQVVRDGSSPNSLDAPLAMATTVRCIGAAAPTGVATGEIRASTVPTSRHISYTLVHPWRRRAECAADTAIGFLLRSSVWINALAANSIERTSLVHFPGRNEQFSKGLCSMRHASASFVPTTKSGQAHRLHKTIGISAT